MESNDFNAGSTSLDTAPFILHAVVSFPSTNEKKKHKQDSGITHHSAGFVAGINDLWQG